LKRLDEVKGKFGEVFLRKLVIRGYVIHGLAIVVKQTTVRDIYAGYTSDLLQSICNLEGGTLPSYPR
jgi:hypothetical protein